MDYEKFLKIILTFEFTSEDRLDYFLAAELVRKSKFFNECKELHESLVVQENRDIVIGRIFSLLTKSIHPSIGT